MEDAEAEYTLIEKEELVDQDFSISGDTRESETREPEENQDFFAYDKKTKTAVVLDGVGGVADGREASHSAGEFLQNEVGRIPINSKPEDVAQTMYDLMVEASSVVAQKTTEGATTATVVKAVTYDDQDYAVIANIGDSRAYLFRDERLHVVTLDHCPDDPERMRVSYEQERYLDDVETVEDINELKRRMNEEEDNEQGNYPNTELFLRWQHRNDLGGSFLGEGTQAEPKVHIVPLRAGDRIAVLTDGISGVLPAREIEKNLLHCDVPEDAVDGLINDAVEAARQNVHEYPRVKPDDKTGIIMDIGVESYNQEVEILRALKNTDSVWDRNITSAILGLQNVHGINRNHAEALVKAYYGKRDMGHGGVRSQDSLKADSRMDELRKSLDTPDKVLPWDTIFTPGTGRGRFSRISRIFSK